MFAPKAKSSFNSADGAVNVHVKVDEKGCVVSAKAISGHPLLRSAAEQTARQAKLKAAKTAEILIFKFTTE